MYELFTEAYVDLSYIDTSINNLDASINKIDSRTDVDDLSMNYFNILTDISNNYTSGLSMSDICNNIDNMHEKMYSLDDLQNNSIEQIKKLDVLNAELNHKNTNYSYRLFVLWTFIFIIVLGTLIISIVETRENMNIMLKFVLFLFIIFIFYHIIYNFSLYITRNNIM